MNTEPTYYVASDYAGIEAGNLKLYYGYEVTENDDPDGEWCFRLSDQNGPLLTIPGSRLPAMPDVTECADCLLAGIAASIQRGYLKLS